ncbi:MAG: ATP-binding protein, partial [Puniceicoccales bacterium]
PGVPEEHHETVFEPFFSQHPEGSGLGLASVRAVMRMHGGEVKCGCSTLGGAKFSLTFPKRSKAKERPQSNTPPAEPVLS